MKAKIDEQLLNSPDDLIEIRVGISNFNKVQQSYPKMLNNNNILAYDDEAIYLIDKLHLTFTSTTILNSKIRDSYYKRESIPVNSHLLLKANYKNGNNYRFSFAIELDGFHFGFIHFNNTKRKNIHKVEIDNRILYEMSNLYIIACLFHIATVFDLQFNNISLYEVACDSQSNIYSKLSNIFYQSTRCNNVVHKLSGKAPIYSPISRIEIQNVISKNGNSGTFTLGTKNSNSMVRIYNKSSEISDKENKKNYISDIYLKHFKTKENISRTEVVLNANAFNKSTGIIGKPEHGLLTLLTPSDYPSIFYKGLGNKLMFKDLTTRKWDEHNNLKYDKINLLPTPDGSKLKFKSMKLAASKQRFNHNNHINKYKFKIIEFLDDEINYSELKKYFKRKDNEHEFNADTLQRAIDVAYRNYHNTIDNHKKKEIEKLYSSLVAGSGLHKKLMNFIDERKKHLMQIFFKKNHNLY